EELNFSEPNWVKENNLNDLKIAIGNVDSDEKIDIVMMYFNAENSKAFISVADFTDTLNYKEPKQIDYVKNLVDSFITIGNISSSYIKRGFIVDTPSLQDGYYVTNVFYLKDGVLQSKNFDLSITKPSYMPVIDIDFDGVLEIPYYSMTYRASNDGNVDWYKFNTLNNSFKFWKQIYYNYNYNFKVQIADKLKGKIFVENDNENLSKQNSCQFNFYYYDDEFDYRKNLFSIIIENTKLEAENKTVVSNKIKLCDYENYSYYYKINDYDELKKLKLTQENIKDSFSIIFE
ncbi:MAG: hypothetical protein LBR30_00615, partial [Clostridioides sp.]|nr:hypothetical protein [Clostridioides sp.]